MTKAAVICELNPFHNGHKFLIEKIKSDYADDVICIMSGDFVQRGDIAITDKYSRAKAALENGADMIVELPTVYSVAAAPVFADKGVTIAKALGCDLLCFGAEDSLEDLTAAVDEIDSPESQAFIAKRMRAGAYYPQAVSAALGAVMAEIVKKPNNILAIEYIRACRTHGITPVAIPRIGVNHNADSIAGNIASGAKIREMIVNRRLYHAFTPMKVFRPATLDDIEAAILFKLKTMDTDELALMPDVDEGLENRIYDLAIQYNSIDELLMQIKTKRYTMARLRRILIQALLDITKEMQNAPVPYIRVLGVRKDKTELLHCDELPLMVDVRRVYNRLEFYEKEIFNVELKATEAMNIAQRTSLNEFSYGVIKV